VIDGSHGLSLSEPELSRVDTAIIGYAVPMRNTIEHRSARRTPEMVAS